MDREPLDVDLLDAELEALFRRGAPLTSGEVGFLRACGREDLDTAAAIHARDAIDGNMLGVALNLACRDGRGGVVSWLLGLGQRLSLGVPIANAAGGGHAGIVELLISRGASDIDAALVHACAHGHLAVAQLLVGAGASVCVLSCLHAHVTPLNAACHSGNGALVEWLLGLPAARSADCNIESHDGTTALMALCARGQHALAAKLIALGGRVDKANAHGTTAFLHAARCADPTTLAFLARSGANTGHVDRGGCNAVHMACTSGRLDNVKFLDSLGLSLDLAARHGTTPFMFACASGALDVVRHLVARGANVHAVNHDQQNAASFRVPACNAVSVVALLLELGVDVDLPDTDGNTLFQRALEEEAMALVRFLLERNAVDINRRDRLGRTPLVVACGNGHRETALMLANTEAVDVHEADLQGTTPLALASMAGDWELACAIAARE